MTKNCFAVAVFAAMISVATPSVAQETIERRIPFPQSANAAQKVANMVVVYGKPTQIEYYNGVSGSITKYELRIYFDYGHIYLLSVIDKGNYADLKMNYYLSTAPTGFTNASPADLILDELMYGRPKIHREVHISDENTTGTVTVYQNFEKKRGPVYAGFTREERDRGKRAGVKEYLFDQGMVFKRGLFWRHGWIKASPGEVKDIQEEYVEHLNRIVGLLP